MCLEEINKVNKQELKNQLRKVQQEKVIKKEKQLEEQVNIQEEELND
jgi:hypothetical protein